MDDFDPFDADYIARLWGGHPRRLAAFVTEARLARVAAECGRDTNRLRAILAARAERRRKRAAGYEIGGEG